MNHAEYGWEPAAGGNIVLDIREPGSQGLGSPSGVFEAREPGTPHDDLRATQDGMAPSHGLLSPPPSSSPLWSGLTAGLTGDCRGFQAFPVSLDVTQ